MKNRNNRPVNPPLPPEEFYDPLKFMFTFESAGFRNFIFRGTGIPIFMFEVSYYTVYLIYAIAYNLYKFVDDIENYIKGDINDGRSIILTLYFKAHFNSIDEEVDFGENYTQVFKVAVHTKNIENGTEYKKIRKVIEREFKKQFPGYNGRLNIIRLHLSIQVKPKK